VLRLLISGVFIQISSRPKSGAEINRSDSHRLNIARLTNPHQYAGSLQPCFNPQQETMCAPYIPSPPLPSLTLFGASLCAPASTSASTTGRCPFCAAANSGVHPPCGASPRVSTRPLRPTQEPPTCAPLGSNRRGQETSLCPHLEGYSVVGGGGGS
jgi:hypothetical protein